MACLISAMNNLHQHVELPTFDTTRREVIEFCLGSVCFQKSGFYDHLGRWRIIAHLPCTTHADRPANEVASKLLKFTVRGRAVLLTPEESEAET